MSVNGNEILSPQDAIANAFETLHGDYPTYSGTTALRKDAMRKVCESGALDEKNESKVLGRFVYAMLNIRVALMERPAGPRDR